MASSLLLGGLIYGGYLLNKDGKQPRGEVKSRQKMAKEDTPNGDNIYNSKQFQQNRHEERKIQHKRYELSKDPINTNMIPGIFNSLGINECCDYSPVETSENGLLPDAARQNQEKKTTKDQNKVFNGPMFNGFGDGQLTNAGFSELSETGSAGIAVDNSGGWGSVTDQVSQLTGQALDASHNNQVPFFSGNNPILRDSQRQLETFTGADVVYQPKRELEQDKMFAPVQENIYGTPNMPDELRKERYIQSNMKTNVLPFPQIRVGSGLNQEGFGSQGADGFHSYFRPHERNIDELRPLSNPAVQYEGRVIVGARESAARRGQVGQVSKNQPDRFYLNEPARWGRGRAANLENRMDEDFATALQCTNAEFEIEDLQGHAVANVHEARPGMERADYEGRPLQEGFDGNGGHRSVNSLHRATYKTTHENQYQRNVSRPVKESNNENVMKGYTIYDQERETTGPNQDNNQLNIRGEVGEGQMQFFDQAQQTIADTLPHADTQLNVKANRAEGMGYEKADYEADFQPTNKQFTSMRGYTGIADRTEQGQGYENEFIDGARTTTRETMLGAQNYTGVANTAVEEPVSYATYFAAQRDRKYVNNPDYKGPAGSAHSARLVNRGNYDNAIIRSRQERLLKERKPTQVNNTNITVGAQDINMHARRQMSSIPNQYALSGGAGGGSGVRSMAPTGEMYNNTSYRKNPPKNIEWQIDPSILDQFKSNPYTQSLHSY